MNPGCAPAVIILGQAQNQAADLLTDFRPATSGARPPTPIKLETVAMPADDGFRFDDEADIGPRRPKAPKGGPEQPVEKPQSRTRPLALEDGNLLAEGKDFQGHITASAEEDAASGQQREEKFEHELPL